MRRLWIALLAAVPLVPQATVPKYEVKRTDTDTGWTLEASIPWANFEELSRRPPVPGTVWKANFNRWDGVQPARRMSIWSDPQTPSRGRTCRRGSAN
jgi:hypothetical protein